MKVIIEGYAYRSEAVREVLRELSPLENVEGEISVNYVGYYYNPQLRDCVFLLPKVLVDERNRVFSRHDPHDIVDVEKSTVLSAEERGFIYEFAVWIYRAIEVYHRRQPESNIIYHRHLAEMGKGRRKLSNTYLDILLALLRFQQDHQHFFTTVLRNLHSGYNKINWRRTIARTTAWMEQGAPLYLHPVNKQRRVNTDEELLVIYYSILHHLHETYGFPQPETPGYELIRGRKFEQYVKGYGTRRLKQIKYRYFSDIQLQLWELCYAFFDRSHRIHVVGEQREYLLAKNFNIVFEAIIDELVGDSNVPRGLKEQGDGKRVDHIYSYQSLTHNHDDARSVYYIGDSKYYKLGNEVSQESVYKQFTYARNVIQWNLNLFLDDRKEDAQLRQATPKYRDDQTEGYNIVPNFFISAKMNEALSYADTVEASARGSNVFVSRHFENRLFDRDTLLVCHYDVNFLYVVSLYARENAQQKARWKTKVRALFRQRIQEELEARYAFYAMVPKSNTNHEAYLKEHFQELLGKVYRPFAHPQCLSLALDQEDSAANAQLLEKLRKDYHVVACPIGTSPETVLGDKMPHDTTDTARAQAPMRNGILMVMMEQYQDRSKKFLEQGALAIGLKMTRESMEILENLHDIGHVLFHHRNDTETHLFAVKGQCVMRTQDEVKADTTRYANVRKAELYVAVDIDSAHELDSTALCVSLQPARNNSVRYDPQFSTFEALTAKEE